METMVVVERKGKKHLPGKESQRKKVHMVSQSSKELVLLPAPNVDEVPRFGKKTKASGNGPNDGFPLDKNWDESQLKLKVPFISAMFVSLLLL